MVATVTQENLQELLEGDEVLTAENLGESSENKVASSKMRKL